MYKKEKLIFEEQAFIRMARLCSQKEYCSFDISQKLYRMNLVTEEIDNIVNRLIKDNYLNDERFVRSYIGDKLKINKWGRKKIELSLRQKQVNQSTINKIFNEYSEVELNKSLESVLLKKWKSIKGKTENDKKGKLIRFALGRGFGMKDIISCMNSLNLSPIDDE
jgi:regulatory protein